MTEETRAVVIEYGGKSYIKIFATYYYSDGKNLAANGHVGLGKAPGDDGLFVFDGSPVKSLQKITPPRRIVTKYELRADLRGSPKEETLSVSEHGNASEADQALYTAVYENIPREAEDIPFVIQKEKGPPSKLPQGIICTDQNYFARYPSFHHLGPVRATPRYMLYRVAKKLESIIAGNRYIKWSWVNDKAEEILTSRFKDSIWVDVAPMLVNGIEVTGKNLHTRFSIDPKDSQSYSKIVAAIDGAGLDDLETKVSAYVEQITAKLSSWVQPDKCPCCQRRFAKKGGS